MSFEPLSRYFILDGDADPSSHLSGASVLVVLAKAFCSCPSISSLHLTHAQSLCLHSSQRSHLVWLVSDPSWFLSCSGKHTHRKAATSPFPLSSPCSPWHTPGDASLHALFDCGRGRNGRVFTLAHPGSLSCQGREEVQRI